MIHDQSKLAAPKALLDALAREAGPDWKLDREIHWCLIRGEAWAKERGGQRFVEHKRYDHTTIDIPFEAWAQDCPAYTRELGAAITLYLTLPERVPSDARACCREALGQWREE